MTKITISRLETNVGTFRVSGTMTLTSLILNAIEILGSDGWEALIIDPQTQWYKTLIAACEVHLAEQKKLT
ncbi:hypothetical protein [Shewanella sp. MEBiC00475]|uniref:Uncharacterized protein n=1 Tax=Shewanella polaris TaxID=2588449 RepID=A0A4Y5YDG5_9GAMM|nr:hypothetical protein [Shewanella sp. MEBiC00475]QDE30628.1 hypothetical protein FH971_06365 [Shewanella polaris]